MCLFLSRLVQEILPFGFVKMTPLQKGQPRTQGLKEWTDCCLASPDIYSLSIYIYTYIYIYIPLSTCLLQQLNQLRAPSTSASPTDLKLKRFPVNEKLHMGTHRHGFYALVSLCSSIFVVWLGGSSSPAEENKEHREPCSGFQDWLGGRKCSAENLLNKRADKCSRPRSPEWKDRFRFSKREILFPVRRPCWSVDRHVFNLESKKRQEEREKIYTSIDPK